MVKIKAYKSRCINQNRIKKNDTRITNKSHMYDYMSSLRPKEQKTIDATNLRTNDLSGCTSELFFFRVDLKLVVLS
jgi:hypothetical protein